jgi:hypothetical protein
MIPLGEITWPVQLAAGLVAALAGCVDAIAGGGGLLTLPALLLAGLPPHAALATNKGQSVFGSGMALAQYARSPLLDRARALPGFSFGLAGAAGGVLAVLQVPPKALLVLVMALLTVIAVVLVFRRPRERQEAAVLRPWWVAAAVALLIGAYDGFFGPGTGTFLIMAYAWLWREPLHHASANAKAVNFASNLAALLTFLPSGQVCWALAAPMALGQALGAWAGAHLTIRRGAGLVRYLVIAVSLALLVRLAWQWRS